MPSLVKVGFSYRDPENRAKELNGTASPHPHSVEFAVMVDDPQHVETILHSHLKKYHEGKEWFACTVSIAKEAIFKVTNDAIQTHGKKAIEVCPLFVEGLTPKKVRRKIYVFSDHNNPRDAFVTCSTDLIGFPERFVQSFPYRRFALDFSLILESGVTSFFMMWTKYCATLDTFPEHNSVYVDKGRSTRDAFADIKETLDKARFMYEISCK